MVGILYSGSCSAKSDIGTIVVVAGIPELPALVRVYSTLIDWRTEQSRCRPTCQVNSLGKTICGNQTGKLQRTPFLLE